MILEGWEFPCNSFPHDRYENEGSGVSSREGSYGYFWNLVRLLKELRSTGKLYIIQVEGAEILERSSDAPKAADLVTAAQAGYRWKKTSDGGYALINPIQMPALVNFDLHDCKNATPKPGEPCLGTAPESPPNGWGTSEEAPKPAELVSSLAAGYHWIRDPTLKRFVLEPAPGKPTTEQPITIEPGLPDSDTIINRTLPYPRQYVYVELRSGDPAKARCDNGKALCGYLRVGNFMSVMRRLSARTPKMCGALSPTAFGVRSKAPPWADRVVSYPCLLNGKLTNGVIYIPNNQPGPDPENPGPADGDRETFLMLYKLYQTAIGDTSKLLPTTTPITISK